MTDLTLSNARSDRDALADRTDVIDKVGALRCLPGDMHVMTSAVAAFYEVDPGTIRQTVNRNREEFDDDGYLTISRSEFEGSYNMSLPSSASTVALFPRRAVLRIGMLLRDSTVARQVRNYLLESEEDIRETEDELIHRALEASTRRIAALTEFKRAIEGGSGLSIREFHKKYFSAVNERAFFDHLYNKGLLINQRSKGSLRKSGPRAGTFRDGAQHRRPSYKGKPYFYMHGSRDQEGFRRENTHVRPGEPELALRDLLASQGLPANENTHGIYALESGDSQ